MQAPAKIGVNLDGSDRRKTAESGRETVVSPKAGQYVIGPAGICEVETRPRAERTTQVHGISPDEVDRATGAYEAMQRLNVSLFHVTVAAHDLPRARFRSLLDEFCRQLRREMNLAGSPRRYWIMVWHSNPSPHVHMLVAFPRGEGARRLRNLQERQTFARHDRPGGGRCIKVQPATAGWLNYVLEERTPQANYGNRRGQRRAGSHRLEGGGDRVRLSADLRHDAIEHGWVRDWKATNARRSESRKPRRSTSAATAPAAVPHLDRYGGLLFPLPVVHALPRHPTVSKPRRPGGDPVGQGALPLQSGNIELLDVLRHLGRTDAERAAAIGLSRPTVNNVRHGRFGLSREAARRILAEARSRGIAA